MQDKDFDKLFKQRFDTYEVEPSASAWQKINRELDSASPKRRKIPSFWMAAASVLILASASLWLYRPVKVIQLHGKTDNQVVKVDAQAAKDERAAEKLKVLEPDVTDEATVSRPTKVSLGVSPKRQVENKLYTVKNTKPAIRKEQNQQYKTAYQATQPISNPLKDAETTLVAEQNSVLAARVEEVEIESDRVDETIKPRIKTIGGLVNFVIAQVDKRDDKIIEFKDGEEGSSLSGINLGPLKFKSRNK